MKQINYFIELTRLKKPIGFMLLFWPCLWGLTIAFDFSKDIQIFIKYLLLFFLGSVLMRSAGCIFNDIVDKDFDKKINRTNKRPLVTGKVSIMHSFIYVIILCSMAFFILIQFNLFTILLGLGSMILAFAYPFMKRITYWPQLFLGITFNWGILMAWASIYNNLGLEIIILYIAAIFWTLGYDTIYGAQDMSEDEIIGLKSTSIKFKKNIGLFVFVNYLICATLIAYLFNSFIGSNIFTIFLLLFMLSLVYQSLNFKINKKEKYLKLFKLNNYSGLLLFLGILFI